MPTHPDLTQVSGLRSQLSSLLPADGSPVTDLMERFEHAFELGVLTMAKEQLQRNAELRDLIAAIQKDLADQNSQNDLLAIVNRNLSAELVLAKQSLKNYTAAIESL
jgi:Zn-dependent M32 family carboxypeptidase